MQKLNLSEEEKISRKDYMKKKKKQIVNIKKVGKKKYIILSFILILVAYVFYQFYVYYRDNNYSYSTDSNVDNQKLYDIYYLSVGYTYSPKTTLSKMKSDGLISTVVYQDLCFTNMTVETGYIYGMKDTSISRLNKLTNEVEVIYEKDVNKYVVYGNQVFATVGTANKLISISLDTKEVKELGIESVTEILVDENYLFLCVDMVAKKSLVRINKDGLDKKVFTNNEKVSYIIQTADKLYFVNKADSNKIYSVNKDGSNIVKVSDIKSVSDNGSIQDVDGSKNMFVLNNILYYINTEDNRNLWKIDLETKATERVIAMSVDILEVADSTVFYKVKDENGVYLYNLETKFTSRISSRLITEFSTDK